MNRTFSVYCDKSCHLENDGLYKSECRSRPESDQQ